LQNHRDPFDTRIIKSATHKSRSGNQRQQPIFYIMIHADKWNSDRNDQVQKHKPPAFSYL